MHNDYESSQSSGKYNSDFLNPLVYQQNMDSLKRFRPDLYEMAVKHQNSGRFILVKNQACRLNLLDKANNAYYYGTADPYKDVQEQIEALKLRNTRLAIFLGFGLGYELIYFLQNLYKKQNTAYILIIEKEIEIFLAALSTMDLTRIIEDPGITFLVGAEENNLYVLLQDYLVNNERVVLLKAVNPVYHPSAMRINKAYYIKTLQVFRDAATLTLEYFGNDPYDSLLGTENMLANLAEIIDNPGINMLQDKFAGKPAIVVSSGPSLNKNKHLLKGLEDKAVIICADSTLRILMDIGVKPHLVASLERVPPTVKIMEGYQAEDVQEVYYAACPVVPPGAYQAYPGPRIMVFRKYKHFEWLGIERGILRILFSAGNMAFKLAETLGCDPIILVGQDLSFSRDGDTHARGSLLGEKQEVYYQRQPIEVMGNDGKPVITEWAWYNCIKAYESDVAGCKAKVMNSTEGGAYIIGTQIMPLQESIQNYIGEAFYPRERIKQILASFSPENKQQDFVNIRNLMNITISDMEDAVDSCRWGLQVVEKHKRELENFLHKGENYQQVIQKLPLIKEEIVKYKESFFLKKTVQDIFSHVVQSYAINHNLELFAIPGRYEDRNLAEADILLRQAEWFAVNGDLASICLNSLKNARQKLELEFAQLKTARDQADLEENR
ncbi:MAG: DUF115 domain-containing protein [Syntrophomonadaceae bacterium]|nr:DUF115 domain-containing protein [Syntrophomonadaceae bacterium]